MHVSFFCSVSKAKVQEAAAHEHWCDTSSACKHADVRRHAWVILPAVEKSVNVISTDGEYYLGAHLTLWTLDLNAISNLELAKVF